jgi:hypothetical protein
MDDIKKRHTLPVKPTRGGMGTKIIEIPWPVDVMVSQGVPKPTKTN